MLLKTKVCTKNYILISLLLSLIIYIQIKMNNKLYIHYINANMF